jgi:hypothetical protein
VQSSSTRSRRNQGASEYVNGELSAGQKQNGRDLHSRGRVQIRGSGSNVGSSGKWLSVDQNGKSGGGTSLNHNSSLQQASLLGLSPDPILSKNSKVNAQLAPLNHFSPALGSAAEGGKALISNIPSIEQLATYNRLQPLNHVPI